MLIVNSISEVREVLARERRSGRRIVFVPTMGALHKGHLSLVDIAREYGDFVVMSIFVNALQFNAPTDLEHYPRTLESDVKVSRAAGVDLLFVPSDKEIYPDDASSDGEGHVRTVLRSSSISKRLCGASRPGHFDGVVTVVAILFNIVRPDVAVFGEKDFQQLRVIEDLVRDLHYGIEIVSGPLIRDVDGVALSSRNARLSAGARLEARSISQALFYARECVGRGERQVDSIRRQVVEKIEAAAKVKVDYVEICDPQSLEPVAEIVSEARLLVAAVVDDVRLIDNIALSPEE